MVRVVAGCALVHMLRLFDCFVQPFLLPRGADSPAAAHVNGLFDVVGAEGRCVVHAGGAHVDALCVRVVRGQVDFKKINRTQSRGLAQLSPLCLPTSIPLCRFCVCM